MDYYNIFDSVCPNCGEPMDFPPLDEDKEYPEQGDFCICSACSNIAKYNKNMKTIPVTESEMMILADTDPEMFGKIKVLQSIFSSIFGMRYAINLN